MIKYLIFLISFFTFTASAEQYYFTSSIIDSKPSIKPNEYCRKGGFDEKQLLEKCTKHGSNGFICKMKTESYAIHFYKDEIICKRYLNKAIKGLK